MNIFDSDYRPKWKIEWDAHGERVREERLKHADHYHESTEQPYSDFMELDEERDIGLHNLRDPLNRAGDYGWYWHDEDPQPVQD